jgi:hypothetical protein
MTLILTHFGRHGIVLGSDSNLSATSANRGDHLGAGEGQKVFPVPHLMAGLALAGSYQVGSTRMDAWMTTFISEQGRVQGQTLRAFARALAASLDLDPSCRCLIHIAGYSVDTAGYHPELWFVRNIAGIDPATGDYVGVTPRFKATEDFWTRDAKKDSLWDAMHREGFAEQYYANGHVEGRMAYMHLAKTMGRYWAEIWSVPQFKFRPPATVWESEHLVALSLEVVRTAYLLSPHHGRIVGGPAQTLAIPHPGGSPHPLQASGSPVK